MAGFWVGVPTSLGLLFPSSLQVFWSRLLSRSLRRPPLRQIGLGESISLSAVTVPTEIVLWRGVSRGTRSTCTDIQAGMRRLHLVSLHLVSNYAC